MSKSPKTDNKIYTWNWEYLEQCLQTHFEQSFTKPSYHTNEKITETQIYTKSSSGKIFLTRGINSLIEHIFMVIKIKIKTETSMPKQDKIYSAIRSVPNIQAQIPEGKAFNYISQQTLLWLKGMGNTILSDFYTNTIFLFNEQCEPGFSF